MITVLEIHTKKKYCTFQKRDDYLCLKPFLQRGEKFDNLSENAVKHTNLWSTTNIHHKALALLMRPLIIYNRHPHFSQPPFVVYNITFTVSI